MYCSSCGIEVSKELNYCNRCGANLNPSANLPAQVYAPPVKLAVPVIALSVTVVLSLIIIFSAAVSLHERGLNPVALAWIVIISMAMVFGIVGHFSRLITTFLKNSSGRTEAAQPPAQLRKPQPNEQLPAAPTGPMNAPIASVTDHTTRTFDPVYRERRK
ncbi:MAG TPA: hypothetical protein VJS44_08000 [Pyrinomonadaceae bacterium]|nr:hypothetical protein [Pyrinomonadaceae bacterium]